MRKLLINKETHVINRDIYSHFIEHLGRCIYEGIWVGVDSEIPNINGIRTDVVEALKRLDIPVIRWPGGCFADNYHWKDGVGKERKKIVNTNWGGLTEDNTFGTHEFFELVEQLDTEAYVNVNVGSGTVQEVQEWIEYMTSSEESPMTDLRKENGRIEPWKIKYIGVGNEAWGCGGMMRPEYYADIYRQYQTYIHDYSDTKLIKIASGPNIDDYNWTDVVVERAGDLFDGIALHHYSLVTKPGETKPATGFPVSEWYSIMKSAHFMEDLIVNHNAVIEKHDKDKRLKLVVDEWGSWYTPEKGTNPGFLYQINTIRDVMIAAINLNVFHKHADKIQMANLAQMVNVLMAVIQTDKEKMLLTPTFYLMEMYKDYQDSNYIDIEGEEIENISETAGLKDDILSVSICNYDHEKSKEIVYSIDGIKEILECRVISGDRLDAHNTFENPYNVISKNFDNYEFNDSIIKITVPPMSVVGVKISL